MSILFIGHYDDGSTSGMRGEYLKEILKPTDFTVANIDFPLRATTRLFRSIGWRSKRGPLIKNINDYVLSVIGNKWDYDLVWVEKGVFIEPSIIERLSKHSKKTVHFTPDPAFTYHRSRLFYKALRFYDCCVTTKSFEKDHYIKNGVKQLIICTQGFDPKLHKPYYSFEEKKGIVFIGHREKDREEIIAKLLDKKYPVTLAGNDWGRFAKKNKLNPHLTYLGNGIFGEQYARVLSGGLLSLGLLSKIIPEQHTTRTIEIPACGTALVTEKNSETEKIYTAEEAIFFRDADELFAKVEYAFAHQDWLQGLTKNGLKKVQEGGYDYGSILQHILKQVYHQPS